MMMACGPGDTSKQRAAGSRPRPRAEDLPSSSAGAVRLLASAETAARGGCPEGMVSIPKGELGPERPVERFCLDVTEVTVEQYARCVEEHKCNHPEPADECNWGVSERRRHPMNCITHQQAERYCTWSGKRLPSDAEWQWAASGHGRGNPFPWGIADPDDQLCWSGKVERKGTCEEGAFPGGNTADGLVDLAGNVAEWTSTPGDGVTYSVRGDNWAMSEPSGFRTDAQSFDPDFDNGSLVGVRCAKSLP